MTSDAAVMFERAVATRQNRVVTQFAREPKPVSIGEVLPARHAQPGRGQLQELAADNLLCSGRPGNPESGVWLHCPAVVDRDDEFAGGDDRQGR